MIKSSNMFRLKMLLVDGEELSFLEMRDLEIESSSHAHSAGA